jgi:hypothetical protein
MHFARDFQVAAHVLADKLEARMRKQVGDIGIRAGHQIIEAQHLPIFCNQQIAQMRTQKTGSAGDDRSQFESLLPGGAAIAAPFRGNSIILEKTEAEKRPPVIYSDFSRGAGANPVV